MITAGLTTSFKEQVLLGEHDLVNDVLKVALYTSDADLGPDTTVYSTTNEVSGTGYTAGGNVVLNVIVQQGNGTGYATFDNPTWPGANFTTRGALIYNDSVAGKPSVAVLDFGADKTVNNDTFTVIFPTPDANNAIVRIS